MSKTFISMLVLSTALLVGCNDTKQTPATTAGSGAEATASAAANSTMTPEQLGELGAEIEKSPAKADEILAGKGLDRTSFEQQIRRVTENPEDSKRYAEAYRRASA